MKRKAIVIDLFPPPPFWQLDRAAWIATAPELRDEVIRMWREIEQGVAVTKDKFCGRPKSHLRPAAAQADSFFALHLLDHALWKRPDDAALQEKAAALRLRLAPDAARYAAMQARDADLEPFHALAKAGGKNLADVLAQYISVENMIRQDLTKGLELLAKRSGINLADVLTVAAAGVHLAHQMLLQNAADAIRREPDKDWNGLHFGFMAQEVERVRPDCVVMMPDGYLAVNYERLSKTPEARSLPVYSYEYKDGGDGIVPDAAA
jgi:hypothetical protein